jgi:hypothetical protein
MFAWNMLLHIPLQTAPTIVIVSAAQCGILEGMDNLSLDESVPSQSGQSPKERLECLKLEVEIAQLRKPLWKHGSFWLTLLTAGTVLVGGMISWSSGWFDLKQLEIKNGNLLLEAENKRLLAQKEALTSETSKLDASRIALNVDLGRLNERRIEEQQNIVLLTNQLSQLQRQRDEKEDVIRMLNVQVSKLTKENKEAQVLVTRMDKLQTDRDKGETQVLILRSRLANAHELARNMQLEAAKAFEAVGASLTQPAKLSGVMKGVASWTFVMGKWRAAYEEDLGSFKLGELANTNAVNNLQQ